MPIDYTIPPTGSLLNYTIITLTHPRQGVKLLYVPDVEFMPHLKSILRDAWVDGYTIIIHPGS